MPIIGCLEDLFTPLPSIVSISAEKPIGKLIDNHTERPDVYG